MALLGNLKGSAQLFQDTEFYNGVATQSLRFEDGDSSYLYRTPSSGGNRRTFTFSAWIKRGNFDENNVGGSSDTTIFSAGTSSVFDTLRFVSQSFTSIKNILQLYTFDGSNDYSEEVNRGFRDVGNWYHIVFAVDTTQSTASNRVKYYVNGTLQTSVGQYYAQVPQNYQTSYNHTEPQWIGRNINSTGRYFDGYMAEVNFVDGTQYDASYFGETKNGVWIAKEPNVTYGTNGFRLQFKEVGGSANSSGIGADTSGNGNHFSISGFTGYDSVWKDCPENNFAVINTLTKPGGSLEFLEGNLKLTRGSVDAYSFAMSTLAVKTGKWYAELRPQGTITSNNHMVGVCITNVKDQSSGDPYLENGQINYVAAGNGHVDDGGSINASTFSGSTSFGAGDIIGVALDLDSSTRTVKFYKNNSLVNTSSYGNLSSEFDDEHIAFMSILFGTNTCMWNFGQDSTFANQITQGGNSDGNGIGDFKYSPPSGYLALCTANFDDDNFATIGPNSATQADDHFNTVLFSGTGSSPLSVTGVGFQPDWLWMKRRDNATNGHHILYDSIRGGTNALRASTNGAPAQFGDMVITFASDGFSFTGTDGLNASSSYSNVAWNWKASGSSVTNNDGSVSSTVSVNTTAGFSIVKATSPSSGTWTVGHGLGATPDFIIQKYLAANSRWTVWQNTFTSGQYLGLNESNAIASSGTPFNFTFNSTVIGGNANYDGTSTDVIYYVFKEIEGYSKFGSYNGNGNADGTFVYTGFRPSWVLIKNTARSADWRLHDIARQPTNDDGGHILLPNSSSAEVTSEYDIDFLSNGFKLRSGDVYENGDGELLIYATFAEDPFKYANAK